jgi:hypothetical protein
VLLVAAFGAFLAFLDSTIVNIAFPAIQSYFLSDISSLSWVLSAYNITGEPEYGYLVGSETPTDPTLLEPLPPKPQTDARTRQRRHAV